jgi:hypothetical protein
VKRLWWLGAMLAAGAVGSAVGSCAAHRFGPVRRLATGQAHPTRIVLDEQSVYWSNQGVEGSDAGAGGVDGGADGGGTVMKIPKSGGSTTQLATAPAERVTALALEGINLYWGRYGSEGTIAMMPSGGGVSMTLVTGTSWPGDLALSSDTLYWSRIGLGSGISSAPKAGGTPTSVLDGASLATFLLLEGTRLYFVDTGAGPQNGRLGALEIGQPTPTILADALARPRHLVAGSSSVYFVTEGDGRVRSVPKAGGDMTTLVYDQQGPYGLAMDETSLYWTNRAADPSTGACTEASGSVVAMSLAELIPVVLADGLGCPLDLAVDDSGVYWAEYGTDGAPSSGAIGGRAKL